MKVYLHRTISGFILLLPIVVIGCERSLAPISRNATLTPEQSPTRLINIDPSPITLPLLDALFQIDETFAQDLKKRLQLTDEQIAQLGTMACNETSKLRESEEDKTQSSTSDAAKVARQKIAEIIGIGKLQQLFDLALEHWGRGQGDLAHDRFPSASGSPIPSESPLFPSPGASPVANASPVATVSPIPTDSSASATLSSALVYNVPIDSRVVINAPAHQMDVFENGHLVKSYKVGIGYPQFPIPYGQREAGSIIFNPSWTPPDEPWVEASKKVKIGQRIAAGDKLNPLGVLKIPVGLPSLIHGGKKPAQIGGFASHGCVGLTDQQARDFAKNLARLGGVELTDEQIARYRKTPAKTKVVTLNQLIPIEFRYDTIVVSDGKLHIYRDVYDRDTNTEENLRAVLALYDVRLEDLTEGERQAAKEALELMSRPLSGKAVDADLREAQRERQRQKNIEKQRMAKSIKGEKEMVIEIAALAGKGYPAPVELDAGTLQSTKDQSTSIVGSPAPRQIKMP